MNSDDRDDLPHATAKSLKILGKIREAPEDFRVEEIPAYPAEGEGEHLMVRFEKVGLDTKVAVDRIARALEVDPREASFAGLKDRKAITTQWASFHRADPERALALTLPEIRILDAQRHRHKLRTGHLQGNRFRIRVRGASAHLETARELLDELVRVGVPNYFGEQRFGHEGRNLERARAWLVEGGRAPRGRFERKLLVSTLQSAAFNAWLSARLSRGEFATAIAGDVMRKEDSGGVFTCDDAQSDQPRVQNWEISPTGPVFGPKMRAAEGPAADHEREALAVLGGDAVLARLGRLGPGSRRPARIRPLTPSIEVEGDDLWLDFGLRKGGYATVLLRELLKQDS
ncbi:MAG: tRNA pseudouridine(13) synthase TruD [Myxococcales bacterium]|nr:tRNA pseudouridine(13) synthase TruD [Myxococcales bacterium]